MDKLKEENSLKTIKTKRFSIQLNLSNDLTCPELDYHKLLKQNKDPLDITAGKEDQDVMFCSREKKIEDDKIAAIVQSLESKYGNKKTHRSLKHKVYDLMDLGMGYDETDSFIDNSEAYDELVPSTLTTKLGGFYINSGVLEFKEVVACSPTHTRSSPSSNVVAQMQSLVESSTNSSMSTTKSAPKSTSYLNKSKKDNYTKNDFTTDEVLSSSISPESSFQSSDTDHNLFVADKSDKTVDKMVKVCNTNKEPELHETILEQHRSSNGIKAKKKLHHKNLKKPNIRRLHPKSAHDNAAAGNSNQIPTNSSFNSSILLSNEDASFVQENNDEKVTTLPFKNNSNKKDDFKTTEVGPNVSNKPLKEQEIGSTPLLTANTSVKMDPKELSMPQNAIIKNKIPNNIETFVPNDLPSSLSKLMKFDLPSSVIAIIENVIKLGNEILTKNPYKVNKNNNENLSPHTYTDNYEKISNHIFSNTDFKGTIQQLSKMLKNKPLFPNSNMRDFTSLLCDVLYDTIFAHAYKDDAVGNSLDENFMSHKLKSHIKQLLDGHASLTNNFKSPPKILAEKELDGSLTTYVTPNNIPVSPQNQPPLSNCLISRSNNINYTVANNIETQTETNLVTTINKLGGGDYISPLIRNSKSNMFPSNQPNNPKKTAKRKLENLTSISPPSTLSLNPATPIATGQKHRITISQNVSGGIPTKKLKHDLNVIHKTAVSLKEIKIEPATLTNNSFSNNNNNTNVIEHLGKSIINSNLPKNINKNINIRNRDKAKRKSNVDKNQNVVTNKNSNSYTIVCHSTPLPKSSSDYAIYHTANNFTSPIVCKSTMPMSIDTTKTVTPPSKYPNNQYNPQHPVSPIISNKDNHRIQSTVVETTVMPTQTTQPNSNVLTQLFNSPVLFPFLLAQQNSSSEPRPTTNNNNIVNFSTPQQQQASVLLTDPSQHKLTPPPMFPFPFPGPDMFLMKNVLASQQQGGINASTFFDSEIHHKFLLDMATHAASNGINFDEQALLLALMNVTSEMNKSFTNNPNNNNFVNDFGNKNLPPLDQFNKTSPIYNDSTVKSNVNTFNYNNNNNAKVGTANALSNTNINVDKISPKTKTNTITHRTTHKMNKTNIITNTSMVKNPTNLIPNTKTTSYMLPKTAKVPETDNVIFPGFMDSFNHPSLFSPTTKVVDKKQSSTPLYNQDHNNAHSKDKKDDNSLFSAFIVDTIRKGFQQSEQPNYHSLTPSPSKSNAKLTQNNVVTSKNMSTSKNNAIGSTAAFSVSHPSINTLNLLTSTTPIHDTITLDD